MKILIGKRPANSIDRVKTHNESYNSNENRSQQRHLSVPVSHISINAKNVRNTFKSLKELQQFTLEIGWPTSSLTEQIEDPLDWIEQNRTGHNAQKIDAFIKVVELALSISRVGQLQAAAAVKLDIDQYRVIYGSTRVMACYLLNRNVDLQIIDPLNEYDELLSHLTENLQRDNLSFSETLTGYQQLFELMIAEQKIEGISRSVIMKTLGMSRTQAGRWHSILSQAKKDIGYRKTIESGSITSMMDAYHRAQGKILQAGEKKNKPSSHHKNQTHSPATENATSKSLQICLDHHEQIDRILTGIFNTELHHHRIENPEKAKKIDQFKNEHFPLSDLKKAQTALDWLFSENQDS